MSTVSMYNHNDAIEYYSGFDIYRTFKSTLIFGAQSLWM